MTVELEIEDLLGLVSSTDNLPVSFWDRSASYFTDRLRRVVCPMRDPEASLEQIPMWYALPTLILLGFAVEATSVVDVVRVGLERLASPSDSLTPDYTNHLSQRSAEELAVMEEWEPLIGPEVQKRWNRPGLILVVAAHPTSAAMKWKPAERQATLVAPLIDLLPLYSALQGHLAWRQDQTHLLIELAGSDEEIRHAMNEPLADLRLAEPPDHLLTVQLTFLLPRAIENLPTGKFKVKVAPQNLDAAAE
jgi:hypothetical protein